MIIWGKCPHAEDDRVKILDNMFLNLKYNFHTIKYENLKCTAWLNFMYVHTHVTTTRSRYRTFPAL